MKTIPRDKRKLRSENTTLALHYQLEHSRTAARLDGRTSQPVMPELAQMANVPSSQLSGPDSS